MSLDIALVLPEVAQVEDFFRTGNASERRIPESHWIKQRLSSIPLACGPMYRDRAKIICLAKEHVAELGATEPRGVRQHGLEHGFELAGRAGDHLQDLGAGRLLLERLGELARTRLNLIEQPHVLDRDHSLV